MRIQYWLILVLCFLVTNIGFAEWINLAPGFDYSSYTIAGPIRVFVTRMSIASTNCTIDSMISQGRLNKTGLAYNGRESVSLMANRYDDTINCWGEGGNNTYWGKRSQVIAAINGDFYLWSVGTSYGGQVQGGWFCKRFPEYSGGSGFVWKLQRVCFLGGNIGNGDVTGQEQQLVAFAQSTATITRVNWTRGTNDLIIYTPQYGPHTYTDNNGTEVVVQMTKPNLPFPARTSFARGTVTQINLSAGSTPIPFDSVVFSGNGTKATYLNSQCTVGQEVRVYMHIKDWGTDGSILLPYDQDWGKAYASIGGGPYCVISSQVPSADWAGDPANIKNPRTAVAFNSTYIYFLVADGRTADSVGMTYDELGYFCRDTLGAEFAINQDGGGSSTLWVDGRGVVNYPSDGSERYVVNGLMMVNLLPMSQTSTFYTGAKVMAKSNAEVRLGPGTNYDVFATAPTGILGKIVGHSCNGVLVKGFTWWKWKYGNTEGWTAEENLEYIPAGDIPDWEQY